MHRRRQLRGFGQDVAISLPAPSTPDGLPHGNERGGIFGAPWVSLAYIDQSNQTILTNSPQTYQLANVFGAPIGFTQTADQVTVVGTNGFGMVVQNVPPPPSAINPYAPPRLPHGRRDGGIFGRGKFQDAKVNRVHMAPPGPRQVMVARMPGLGAGPDGLGGCGMGGCGCGCGGR